MDQSFITASPESVVSGQEHDRTVPIPTNGSFWKKVFAFSGPAFLVSVGYMDPGNWATDIEGGSRFGYKLLWVILASNMIAVLLQTLSVRLGVVTGQDLAQACRLHFKRPVAITLWVLAEVAIGACDLAEILGSAVALNLLFHIPLLPGVFITAFDVLLLLALQGKGLRKVEALIITLVLTVGGCYLVELILAKPDWGGVAVGLVRPTLNRESLFIALAILGATVMPHNLYLHSALVKSRAVDRTPGGLRSALKYNFFETFIALNGAFFVNAAILIMAAAVFHDRGLVVTELTQAHATLGRLFSSGIAALLFGVALLASGQSSTITGTMAGQVVMEGFIQLKIAPWKRRLATRLLAIIPAIIVIMMNGSGGEANQNQAVYRLLILSQAVLSVQLSFATIPLVMFTGSKIKMGEFVNPLWLKIISWMIVAAIAVLNIILIWNSFHS